MYFLLNGWQRMPPSLQLEISNAYILDTKHSLIGCYYCILVQGFEVNWFIYWSIQYWRLWHITGVIYSFGGSTSYFSPIILILVPTIFHCSFVHVGALSLRSDKHNTITLIWRGIIFRSLNQFIAPALDKTFKISKIG